MYEFSIGMGPKILSKKGKNGETKYSLRAIPIGGFCSLAGEGSDEDKKLPKNRLLQSKPVWQRFLVMFFGAGNNFISAFLILFFIALIWGGTTMVPKITAVEFDSAAEKAGIEVGDVVTRVNGHKVKTSDDLSFIKTLVSNDINIENKEFNYALFKMLFDVAFKYKWVRDRFISFYADI